MLDGRSFSKKIKNKFQKPFDPFFVETMNKTMAYLCQSIQGCKIGYCQSDEISLIITDKSEEGPSSSFFGYRLCKIQSITASIATSFFNREMGIKWIEDGKDLKDCPLYEFDSKAWVVPNANDAYAWFLWRQIDCKRNAKQQAAQTYLSHKQLMGHNSDEQIKMLEEFKGIKFEDYDSALRRGRVCYKEQEEYISPEYGTYMRSKWNVYAAPEFNEGDGKNLVIEKIE
jgi:tRNA(His) 5'-end guanylyltransferase